LTKRILITGASSGIGREAALALAGKGHELLLLGRREDALASLIDECREGTAVPFDLGDIEGIPGLVSSLRADGRYPVLVNSAGIGGFGLAAELDWAVVEQQIRINQLAPMRLTQAMLPWMLEAGGGQILNVLSIAATSVLAGCSAYGTSKAALLMFGKVVSAEYRRKGIKVTNLMPGATDTPIWDGSEGGPDRSQMIPSDVVGATIANVIERPHTHNMDELVLMPTFGIL